MKLLVKSIFISALIGTSSCAVAVDRTAEFSKELLAEESVNKLAAQDSSKCFPQSLNVLSSAGAYEIPATKDWKLFADMQQYMGTTSYVPIDGAADSDIVYDIMGPSLGCVSEAVLYTTVRSPGDLIKAKRKMAACRPLVCEYERLDASGFNRSNAGEPQV